ncbi:acetyltransferase [uncultured Deinococcus sp.]|uniref:acetyltransferase n=1 Tax=uncultured Deinococcus sp. TaxID=158789 RepID=UPI0025D5BEB5|nr:acetyltransferase [uncultured Deinococcus sp.]
MSGVLVVGAGGHAKVVIATLRAAGLTVAGVLDDRPERRGDTVLWCEVLGSSALLNGPNVQAVLAIGNNAVRRDIAGRYPGVQWIRAVHPAAVVDASVTFGAGSVVFAGAVVQPDVVIGEHVIVNTGATVDHDCTLGDFVHVAPGTHLAGNVVLDDGVFVGTGAALIPGVRVGAWTTVGAGSVVLEPLPPGVVAFGTPARARPGGLNGRQ